MTPMSASPPAARASAEMFDTFARSDAAGLMVLLDACRADGAVPMAGDQQTLFDVMATPEMDAPLAVFTCDVLREMGQIGMPHCWRAAIGGALLRASAQGSDQHSGARMSGRLTVLVPGFFNANRSFALLMHASLRPDQWLDLCRRGQWEHHVPTSLACSPIDLVQRRQVLRNMVHDGLDIDSPRAAIAGAACTMLHAAAEKDRAEIAALLLELGADPLAKFQRADSPPQDAFALAPEGGTVRHVLAAWRAQRAMDAVLRPGAANAATERP